MRIFQTKWFHKWATKEGLSKPLILIAVDELEKGLIDADLGGHLYKKRIGIQNRGKRGGVRTLVVFKRGEKVFFVYGFAKNQQANLSDEELKWLKRLAKELLKHSELALTKAIQAGELLEVST